MPVRLTQLYESTNDETCAECGDSSEGVVEPENMSPNTIDKSEYG